MHEITAWLQHPDYLAGVKLYDRYGGSSFLKLKFAGGSAALLDKLKAELQKLIPAAHEPQKISKKVTELPAALPADNTRYLQLLKSKERLYLELTQLMEQKHYLPEGQALADCALAILSRHQQLSECWAQIDHYQQHQSFPVEITKTERNVPADQEAQLLRQSISKAKARLKGDSCRNRAKTEQTLQAAESRLAELLKQRTHE